MFSRTFLSTPTLNLKSAYFEKVCSFLIFVKDLEEENIKIHERTFYLSDVRKTLKYNKVQIPIFPVFSCRQNH